MHIKDILISQYLASLEMLKQTITKCPETLWTGTLDKTQFWHIAYHTLFYTHLYLQDSEQSFTPWTRHRAEYNFIGPLPWPPHEKPKIAEPYDQVTLLEYLAFCQQQVLERVPTLEMEAASGFDWLPFSKLELLIYTLRHLQQHTGELMERLGTREGVDIDWVGNVELKRPM